MAKSTDLPQGLMPSILDRLIDPDTEGTAWRRGYDLNHLIAAVRRDLEDLFNAHPGYTDMPVVWQELRSSILMYGMPDLVSVNLATPAQREELGRMVEGIIQCFEPRLRNIRVQVNNNVDGREHDIRFHIEGQLNVDPAPEVAFETVLELTTGHASIELSEPSHE